MKQNIVASHVFIGEHVDEDKYQRANIQKLCKIFSQLIKDRLTKRQFYGKLEWLMDKFGDEIDLSELDYEFFRKAIKFGANRFVLVNNNAFVDIVAVKNNPSAKEIEDAVFLGEQQTKKLEDVGECKIKEMYYHTSGVDIILESGRRIEINESEDENEN